MRQFFKLLLRLSCTVLLALLVLRACWGPVTGAISPRSIVNLAAAAFLSLVGLAYLGQVGGFGSSSLSRSPFSRLLPPCLAGMAVAAYWPALDAPFVFDDYVHLTSAAAQDPVLVVLHRVFLEHPMGGDGFFRPLGILYFWLVSKMAGWDPAAWHMSGLLLHAANTILIFFLLRRLFGQTWTAFAGSVFFAWQASHVEAVCWTAASFDLLATFFCLAAVIAALQERRVLLSTLAMTCFGALACLSKEAAYSLPLLLLCLIPFRQQSQRRQLLVRSLWLALSCLLIFVYRIWYLQGIGGYRTGTGAPIVLNIHPLSLAQALLLRLWGILFLPINWSGKPELWLCGALFLMTAGLVLIAYEKRTILPFPHRYLSCCLLLSFSAASPVFPLLLIGWDLSGARVLYLPSIGEAMFLAMLVTVPAFNGRRWIATTAFAAIALFQLAALLHNELIWKREAIVAHQACVDVADFTSKNPTSQIRALGLPKTRNGVFFLANGFPECVAAATHNSVRPRVLMGPAEMENPALPTFQWDEAAGRIIRTQ